MQRNPDHARLRHYSTTVLEQSSLTSCTDTEAASQRARMIEAIATLDGAATALSARALTTEDLREAGRVHLQIARLAGSGRTGGLSTMCDRLHAILISRCPNAHLRQLVDEELTLLHAVGSEPLRTAKQWRVVTADHAQLLSLARSHAGVEAFTVLLRRHRQHCH